VLRLFIAADRTEQVYQGQTVYICCGLQRSVSNRRSTQGHSMPQKKARYRSALADRGVT
jgi:hypothetical protein